MPREQLERNAWLHSKRRLCLSQIPNNLRTWGLRISTNLRLSTFGVLPALVGAPSSLFRARAALQLENLALRQQHFFLGQHLGLEGLQPRSQGRPTLPNLLGADRWSSKWKCGFKPPDSAGFKKTEGLEK